MVTKDFYLKQIERLSAAYRQSDYFRSKERLAIIWDIVNHLDEEVFHAMITDLIADNVYPPTRNKFIEWLANRRYVTQNNKKETPRMTGKRLSSEEIYQGLLKMGLNSSLLKHDGDDRTKLRPMFKVDLNRV